MTMPPPRSGAATWTIIGSLAVIILGGYFTSGAEQLAFILIPMAALVVLLGYFIVHRPLGALIDSRNLVSLARFQMIVWTVVILSSYLAYAFARIAARAADPLAIKLDSALLTLMGISTASFVGAPLILNTKRDKEPDDGVTAKAAVLANDPQLGDNRQGTLYANPSISDARVTDMFQGDEVGNTIQLDLAKVQMFFFTVVSAGAYLALVVANLTSDKPDFGALPALSPGIVTALGISHAGYLSSKGLDHTPTQ
jgi:hypothetical protein